MKSWVLVLLLWTCASWSMDCGFTTDANGIKIFKCSQCGISTGAGRLNIQSALDNLVVNLKMIDLVPNDLSFSFSLPIPHACIGPVCSPDSIDFGVNARTIMSNLGIQNVNLANGLIGSAVLPADWSSVIGDLCFETSFEMCTAKLRALARLNDVTVFEFDFSLLGGVFNQGCGTVNVGSLSVTYNRNTKTLVISQAISPLFQNGVTVTLRNLTISEEGLSFCGQVNLVGSQPLTFDIGCVEFGTVDTCALYNSNCSECTSNGCGWCAEKGICSSAASVTGLCGGCLSGYLQTCDAGTLTQRITEFKPVLDSFKSIDQNGDFKLSRAESGGKTGKWVDAESNFNDMDQDGDDEVTLAEYKEYQTTKDQPKVSGGAIAGIVIGVLVGVGGIAAASFFVYKKKLWEKIPKPNLPNLPKPNLPNLPTLNLPNLPKIGKQ